MENASKHLSVQKDVVRQFANMFFLARRRTPGLANKFLSVNDKYTEIGQKVRKLRVSLRLRVIDCEDAA